MRLADLEAAGTVGRWTDNSIQAIIRQLSSHVRWPTVNERYDLKRSIKSRDAQLNCVGSLMAPTSTSNMLPLGLKRRLDPSTVARNNTGSTL